MLSKREKWEQWPHKSESNANSSVWEGYWICITMKSEVQLMWLNQETYAIEYFFLTDTHPNTGVGNTVFKESKEKVVHLLPIYAKKPRSA